MAVSAIFSIYFLSCTRVSKAVDLLRKFQNVLTKTSKLLIRSHLEHCDIVHDQVYNFVFHYNLESFLYNASLVITSSIWGTS